jgi:hypothetical protein
VKQIRKRLTYANVMSSIAVFLVLGGATAMAAGLAKNSVGSKQLKKNAVTAAKIKQNAVTTPKVKDGAVTASKLAAGAVGASAIGAGSITGDKLADGAVTGNKIAAGTIGRGNLAEGQFLPRAFGLVKFDGEVNPNLTRGLPNATVVGGSYCFDLPFQVLHAQATGEADGEGNDVPSVLIAGSDETFEECPAGTDVEVEVWDTGLDEATEEEFYLVVW